MSVAGVRAAAPARWSCLLVADALAAFYASAALIVNDTRGRVVLYMP